MTAMGFPAVQSPQVTAPSGMIGQTISHYRIVEEFGESGIDVLYGADSTKRTICFLSLWFSILLLGSPRAAAQELPQIRPENVGLSSERLSRIDELIEEYIAENKVAGTVTIVARAGRVAHLGVHGMADKEAGQPMAVDTIFRIASMTKPITCVAVMMLFEEGRLDLDDPVAKFIPEFKNPTVLLPGSSEQTEPARSQITIWHLLTHTSGLAYQGEPRVGPKYREAGITNGLEYEEKTIAEAVRLLARLPLLHHPGERFQYGFSTDVLGRVVEVVSGMTLDEFFKRRIFAPLRMEDTHFFLPAEKKDRLAAVYARDENSPIWRAGSGPQYRGYSEIDPFGYPYEGPMRYYSGGGGLVSTASDYLGFCQMMLNGGELNGVRLLKRETVEYMTTDHVAESEEDGYGLGVGVARTGGPDGSVGTYGWAGGVYTRFFIDPKEELIGIFMAQLIESGELPLAQTFRVLANQSIIQ